MTTDPFQFVKGVQKGLKKLSNRLGSSRNPKLKEMEKRLSEIGTKMSEKFGLKKENKGEHKEDEDGGGG